jgi:hypothetical protein
VGGAIETSDLGAMEMGSGTLADSARALTMQ